MPLPSQKFGARQCKSKSKRSGNRCLNNAVSDSTQCRMHGYAPYHKVKRGKDHGMYKDGSRTLEAQKQHSEKISELQMIESLGFALGIMSGKRTRGPKAKGYCKVTSVDEIREIIKK